MRPIIILFCLSLMIGCEPKHPIGGGDLWQGEQIEYWKLTGYELKGHKASLNDVRDKHYLEIDGGIMKKDSTLILLYYKGATFRTLAFYDETVVKTSSLKGVIGDYSYNKKTEQNTFWYQMNEESGFIAIVDTDVETGINSKIRLSGVITSANYNPELDSLRFIYEPTAKFR